MLKCGLFYYSVICIVNYSNVSYLGWGKWCWKLYVTFVLHTLYYLIILMYYSNYLPVLSGWFKIDE